MTSLRTRARLVERLRGQGIQNEDVLRAMYEVPRHRFVEEALASRAYEDSALPIGYGQTLSQPWTVAKMTEILLSGAPLRRILEIGTGSGYQATILSILVPQVYSIERLAFFYQQAKSRLREMGIFNVRLRHGDGNLGWPEKGPFDGIVVTAAAEVAPTLLLSQLSLGGRLVMPLRDGGQQRLVLFRRDAQGVHMDALSECCFVPMLSGVC